MFGTTCFWCALIESVDGCLSSLCVHVGTWRCFVLLFHVCLSVSGFGFLSGHSSSRGTESYCKVTWSISRSIWKLRPLCDVLCVQDVDCFVGKWQKPFPTRKVLLGFVCYFLYCFLLISGSFLDSPRVLSAIFFLKDGDGRLPQSCIGAWASQHDFLFPGCRSWSFEGRMYPKEPERNVASFLPWERVCVCVCMCKGGCGNDIGEIKAWAGEIDDNF